MKLLAILGLGFFLGIHSAWADPIVLDVDPAHSSFSAVTYRSGLFGFLGHEHAILATRFVATIRYDGINIGDSRADIVVMTQSLIIDSPDARRLAHLLSKPPQDSDIPSIQAKMLGPEVLDVSRYPQIKFTTNKVEKSENDFILLKGTLEIHGKSVDVMVPVKMEASKNETLHMTASFNVKLSDFGIKAPSKSGVVSVADSIEIRLDLLTRSPTAVASTR